MKTGITFRNVLMRLFKISFESLQRYSSVEPNQGLWSAEYLNYNKRVNRIILLYLRTLSKHCGPEGSKYLFHQDIDSMSKILSHHYKARISIYSRVRILGGKARPAFVLFSIASSYLFITIGFIKSIIRLGYFYDPSVEGISDRVCIAIGFPEHSFALPENSMHFFDKPAISSFGEYLQYSNCISIHGDVVSIDEGVRRSKARENGCLSKLAGVNSYSRRRFSKRWSIRALAENCRRLPTQFSRMNLPNNFSPELPLSLMKLTDYNETVRYEKIISLFSAAGKSISRIYVLPFSSPGVPLYLLNNSYRDFLYTYYYSENIVIPPGVSFRGLAAGDMEVGKSKLLAEINLSSLNLIGNASGFSDIVKLMDKVRERLKDKYKLPLLTQTCVQEPQNSCALGYEAVEPDLASGPAIAIFDVPPESADTQLSRSILGDVSCSLVNILDYLKDIADVAYSEKIRILYKPKYSLTNYSADYRATIEGLCEKFQGSFHLLSPYTRLGDIVCSANFCLSFPYTSTHAMALSLGKKSLFYVPERMRSMFENLSCEVELVVGKIELKQVFQIWKSSHNSIVS